MALNGRVLGATGLVLAGVVAAAVAGQLPAFGVTDHSAVVTPSSARQQLVCPGPVVAIGAQGTKASAVSATGTPVRTTGTASGGKLVSTALGRGNVSGSGAGPRLLTAAAADDGAGAIAGAQAETVTSGDAVGLAGASCTAPTSDAWLAAGSTTTGRTSVLLLANPSTADADVRVRLWTEDGPVDSAASSEVVVPAKSRRAVSLASLAPSSGGIVVRVTTTGARVGAAIEQRTVRGLESGGVDIVGPTAAPATAQVLSGLRVTGAAALATTEQEDGYADLAPVVRVLVPGSKATTVKIVVTGPSGTGGRTLGGLVSAGDVVDFPITGLADGSYSVRVSAGAPVVTGARVSVVGDASASATAEDLAGGDTTSTDATDSAAAGATSTGSDGDLLGGSSPVDTSGASDTASTSSTASTSDTSSTSSARGIDLAWIPAGRATGATAAVAVVKAPSPLLTLANPGAAAVTVRMSAHGHVTTVAVPARGTASAAVAPGVLVLTGGGEVRATVSYAASGAIAADAVLPADQAARAVRVSH